MLNYIIQNTGNRANFVCVALSRSIYSSTPSLLFLELNLSW